MAYALSARGIVLMLLCIAAATSSLGIEQASLLASQTLRVLEWGPGRDLVEIFDKGEPVLLTGSPVRDWPLLSLGEDELHDAIAELQMDSAVFAVQSTTTSPSSPDVGKPAVVVNTAKNLPDNREVIFEPDTRAFELRDTNGAALLASGERNNEEIYKTAGRGGTVQEGISWRSQNLLTETPESKLLWDFFLQGENQFDMRWLFYRLEHGPFDGRPSISFKAMPVGASTPLRQDARHEAIVQLTGSAECLLVNPADSFRYAFLHPTRHIYDASSQFHFAFKPSAQRMAISRQNNLSMFWQPPRLTNSALNSSFSGDVWRTVVHPGDILVVPSSWLVQCVTLSPQVLDTTASNLLPGARLPLALSLHVSSTSDAQVVINKLASDFIPQEWAAMMQSIPHFLNSALQGFIGPVLDRVHAFQQASEQTTTDVPNQICLTRNDPNCAVDTETRPYHLDFFATLLQQRFADRARNSVSLIAPLEACTPYNATHNQALLDPFVEGVASLLQSIPSQMIELFLAIFVESYANAVGGVSRGPAYIRTCLCGTACLPPNLEL
eukprot:INCI1082.1.p1 GENE.INCI1082.1~~INCI1082.1.p1  ORF type:complete len:553 (-),score=67.95 INCI1082.1:1230-2888(-)